MDGKNKKWTGRRLAAASGVAVVSFAAVGYAASLTVTTTRVGAGSAAVSSCNASATVAYSTAYSSALPGYRITTVDLTSAAGCNGLSYRVTLTGAGNTSLGEKTGSLDASGNDTADFSADNVLASNVTGVQLVIAG